MRSSSSSVFSGCTSCSSREEVVVLWSVGITAKEEVCRVTRWVRCVCRGMLLIERHFKCRLWCPGRKKEKTRGGDGENVKTIEKRGFGFQDRQAIRQGALGIVRQKTTLTLARDRRKDRLFMESLRVKRIRSTSTIGMAGTNTNETS
eukprot:GHVT01026505.1.p1 GENE.GHVT01026505.1~~GHVT01026505.1.p1  ORF type:complete len:147 (-),score=0.69 GHVT01026505.1:303-743(-)